MEADHCSSLPEPLLSDILLSSGMDEWYLRPLSLLSNQFLSATNRLKRTLHITNRNAHHLPRLLERFPNIKHINLPFFIDPERFFSDISRCSIRLESLEMSLMSRFPIERFRELPLPSLRSSLKSLKLTYVEDQNDADGDLEIIAELFPSLEGLELCWGYQVTDNGVAMFASKLQKLRRISFAGNPLITDESMFSLVDNCVDLEEISLSHCSSITSEGLDYLHSNISNFKSLVLEGMYDLAYDVPFDEFACNLSTLEFSKMMVPDDVLHTIASADMPLKRLSLSECSRFTLYGIMSILDENHYLLEYICINGNKTSASKTAKPVEGVDLVSLSALLWNVVTVKLNYYCQLSSTQLLALIHNCFRLNTLELKGAQMCVDQVAPALHYDTKSQLRSLNLSFVEMLTDECLQQLASACPHLAELFVTGCKAISHRGVNQIIINCPSLRVVHLNGCEGIFRLNFNIGFAKLEVLEARGSSLDDESLVLIASKCPDLMCLDLSNCWNVTALGVREVVLNCKNLWKLGISFKHYVGSDLEYWIRSTKPWIVNC